MDILAEIQEKVSQRQFEFSRHAMDQSILRNVNVVEVEEAVMSNCEIIEDYPEDKYGSSCLILGFTKQERPLHILTSYPNRPVLKIITIYEPDPIAWKDNRVRLRQTGAEVRSCKKQ